jgi:pimeloyl-ACP methyl ester carboxylesterase
MPESRLRELQDRDGTLKLPDGRTLGFRRHGEEHGLPVFYFHGFPGSRLEAGFIPVKGLALYGVERPGYGRSDPLHRRGLADWPADIAALADHLGLKRFAVLGVSGGGPYAAACAWALPERVIAAAIVCPIGPPKAPGMDGGRMGALLRFGRRGRLLAPVIALARSFLMNQRSERRFLKTRERLVETRYAGVPKEGAALTTEFMRHLFVNWREGVARSLAGVFSDARIYGEAWPFDLGAIRVPVHLWHGEEDRVVPVAVGQHYAAHIPGIRARIIPGEGHFSIIFNSLPEVVETLMGYD